MSILDNLVGKRVMVQIEIEDEGRGAIYDKFEARVIDVFVDDYYFKEKSEPIYIKVNTVPIGEIPIEVDLDLFNDVPLDNIRSAGDNYHE